MHNSFVFGLFVAVVLGVLVLFCVVCSSFLGFSLLGCAVVGVGCKFGFFCFAVFVCWFVVGFGFCGGFCGGFVGVMDICLLGFGVGICCIYYIGWWVLVLFCWLLRFVAWVCWLFGLLRVVLLTGCGCWLWCAFSWVWARVWLGLYGCVTLFVWAIVWVGIQGVWVRFRVGFGVGFGLFASFCGGGLAVSFALVVGVFVLFGLVIGCIGVCWCCFLFDFVLWFGGFCLCWVWGVFVLVLVFGGFVLACFVRSVVHTNKNVGSSMLGVGVLLVWLLLDGFVGGVGLYRGFWVCFGFALSLCLCWVL